MESTLNRTSIPHSTQAEAAVLGCCLLENGCIDDAAAALSSDDFFELRHRNLFELIVKLRNEGTIVDTITVFQEAKDAVDGGLDSLGGVSYVIRYPTKWHPLLDFQRMLLP